MAYIIITNNETPIYLPYYNQNAHESVFAFDKDNKQFIQNFSFQCEITYDNNVNTYFNNILNKDIIEIENGYLFYSFNYQLSYAHFMTQTAPKIIEYINEYNNYKLLIPKKYYNNLYKDIIKYSNIDISNVILLESDVQYYVKNLSRGTHYISPNGSNYDINLIKLYKLLNTSIQSNSIIPYCFKKIYIKRDHKIDSTNNNLECGIYRYIINEEELIKQLKEKGYEIITLGDKSLEEKFKLLINAETIISQLGANCMNFIFLKNIKNLLLLSNTEPICNDYYISLSKEVNNINYNTKLFEFIPNREKCDPKNSTNSPFYVDINMIMNYVNSIDEL